MTCPSCGNNDAKRVRYYRIEGKLVGQCSECPNKHEEVGRLHFRQGSVVYSKSGKMTAAHYHDIIRRRVAPDGKTVYRDRGARSFLIR